MLHPHLREVVSRVENVTPVEVRPCGNGSPETAADINPIDGQWERLDGVVQGVAEALGVSLQHGISERMFTVRERCTHPGHYEIDT